MMRHPHYILQGRLTQLVVALGGLGILWLSSCAHLTAAKQHTADAENYEQMARDAQAQGRECLLLTEGYAACIQYWVMVADQHLSQAQNYRDLAAH